VSEQRIVAVGLLTSQDLELLGTSFTRLWPVDETPCFTQLLHAIDEADRNLNGHGEAQDGQGQSERRL
jgi:hypothetical protein